jgi:hypothetical protein
VRFLVVGRRQGLAACCLSVDFGATQAPPRKTMPIDGDA